MRLVVIAIAACLSVTALDAHVRTADPIKRGLSRAEFPRTVKIADGVYGYEDFHSAGMTTVTLFVVGADGGSGVLINNNIVQSSSGRRSIYVGTSTANNVNGTIGFNQFLGTTPFSEAPGMFISWSNVPIQVRYTACP